MTRGNELAGESSPYLLQHAHNPAHWKPWGPAAFDEARRRDVPIFLSVGYATCHWCHVMERESFEDEAIASIMNEHFVCIKVDREERPEVDEPYMLATQLMTGSGGWPMSVFLEPAELRPFWCATYLPPRPHPHGAGPSFPQVLESIAQAWRQQRAEIIQQAGAVAQAVRENMMPPGPAPIGAGQVSAAVESLLRMFDRTHGGFGAAPKFPQPSFLELLLEAQGRVDEGPRRAIDEAARRTLDRMAVGGLRDHVGGGFHRYCVDATWTVPHFEKMLYDNALLAALYARASRTYADDFYADVARDTLDYIAREMTSPEGAFWCAQDADTDGHEGATYLWTAAQLREVLSPDDAELAIRIYGVDRGPNFRDPHHPDDEPANILRLDDRPGGLADRYGATAADLDARLGAINGRLLAARAQRPQPGLDDKILVAWNGMMIAAMAECAELLGDRSLLDRAAAAADFIEREMTGTGGLRRTWRAGQPGPAATLEDYAWLLTGLAALARAPGAPPDLLARCARLYDEAARRFEDPQRPGLLYDAPADAGFFVRVRSTYDGATPSASSTMLGALIDLAEVAGATRATDVGSATSASPTNPRWLAHAQESLAALSGAIAANPLATVNATRHLLRMLRLDPSVGADAQTPAPEAAPAPTPAAPPTPADTFTPVEIYADRERITLGPGQPAELNLILRIAPGHHIYTPDTPYAPDASSTPGAPLRIHLIRGAGVQVYVDAPEGEPVEAAEGARAFRGEVELRVALERTGELVGKPLLGVTFQACTDSACLLPTTVELDVAIDVTG